MSLACFPLRCEWEQTQPAVIETFPAPLTSSLEPAPEVRPGPIEELAVWARCLGWSVLVAYSRGYVPHATTGKPLGPKDVWTVRCSRHTRRAVARWEAGSWKSFWDWSDVQFFRRTALLAEFKEVLL